MSLLTAGALTDPQLPSTSSNVCTTDAWLGGVGRVPPPTKILATTVRVSDVLCHVCDVLCHVCDVLCHVCDVLCHV